MILLTILLLFVNANGLNMDMKYERIIGGENSSLEEFPYQVAIKINNHHMCSGAILHKSWIVTAAKCIYTDDVSLYQIIAGITNIRNPESTIQTRGVNQIIIHPDYERKGQANDIALIELKEAFDFKPESKVQKVVIANGAELESGRFTISGWGSTSTSYYPIYPEMLQNAAVSIIQNYECADLLTQYLGTPSDLKSSNVCSKPLSISNEGFCTEDTGGPLIYYEGDYKKLYGIMSWHLEPCGQLGAPSVYTRILSHLSFIKTNVPDV